MKREPFPTARDFMTRHVHTVKQDMPLDEVVSFLQRHELSNVPVIDEGEGGQALLVGFISEGDCLEFLANEIFFGSPAQPQTARTMMKRHPVCVDPDTDIFALTSIFVSHRYRHLPVVENGRLLGIVSRRDILRALDRYYRESMEHQAEERFPPDLHEVMNLRFVGKKL